MPDGRSPYVYWVDLDSGLSYWQPPPTAAMTGGAVSGLDALWSPRGVVGGVVGDMSPLPLEPMSGMAKGKGSTKSELASVGAAGERARG